MESRTQLKTVKITLNIFAVQYSYIILFFSSLAEQQIIATIIAVIMESTSQHELSLCSGFFNAQYYIEVRSSSD